MSEPGMFPAPAAPKLALSVHFVWTAQQSNPLPKYAAYKLKTRVQCEECVWIVHEAHGAGGAAIRSATVKRTCMGAEIVLCAGHAEMWKRREEEAPAEAAAEAKASRDAARAGARAVAVNARRRRR